LGPKLSKAGTFVRVQLDSGQNTNNTHDNNGSKKSGGVIWVPLSRVERIIESSNRYQFTIGDRIRLEKKKTTGVIRYVGPTHFEKGVWFGVQLDQPKGKNNGTVKKQFYFEADANCGIFVHQKGLISLDANENSNNKANNKAMLSE